MESQGQPARKRCVRYNEPGVVHALTFSCFQRRQFLNKDRSRQWFVEAVSRARERLEFNVWAYVIMPEHCHLLVYPRNQDYSISRILSAIKIPVSRRARAYLEAQAPDRLHAMLDCQPNGRVDYRFWQRGGGFDRNLSEPRAIYQTIDYIHANPVRRGLVAKPSEWRWSSALFYEGHAEVPLWMNRDTLPTLFAAGSLRK
ncbi:MAG TPA: transposase [Pirellulales bacterium]|nr:transposase [Pirellulales bacterium]